MCLYPKLILNRKYTKNKKNGGKIPAVLDERTKYVPIGCENCMECRKKKARDWQIRLLEEIRHDKNALFVTLTFSNESIIKLIEENECLQKINGYQLDNELATKAIRLWLERWRKKHSKSIKHWLVTELGHNGTENIHLHGIVWSKDIESIANTWQYGYVWPRDKNTRKYWVNEKTVNYIIKYIHKVDLQHKEYKSKILTSPGIGAEYINRPDSKSNLYNGTLTKETYRTKTGHDVALPIYMRNKIYTEEQREKLWIHKLDKNERFIMGEKINADDHKTYFKLLEHYRKINKRLGYGDDEKNWDREEYEKQRRIILYETRKRKIQIPPGG